MAQTLGDALDTIRTARSDDAFADAYLVGGAVRDALLGRATSELDVASARPVELAGRLAELLDRSVVALGGPYELRRVPLDGGWIDVTPMAGGIEADLGRRDFTVNALAVPLWDLPDDLGRLDRGAVVDRHGGLDDLDRQVIRQVSDGALAADPLRALRAVRLSAVLDFAIEEETERAVAATGPELAEVAAERVGGELALLFASERSARGVRLLERTGLLEVCFPELLDGRGVSQRPHHTWDVLEHQLVSLEWMDVLLAGAPPTGEEAVDERAAAIWHLTWDEPWPATRWGAVRDHLGRHAGVLRLATLLHDIGKPSTRTVEADGRTRFFGHGPRGAELAAARLRAWRFPERTIERVALLLEQHLRPGQVSAPGEAPSARALHRFHERLGDATLDVCLLFLADSLATAGAAALLPRWPAYVAHVQRIACWHPPAAAQAIARLVDGHAVLEATELAPGPAIGAILERIAEAAAAGEVTDEAGALELARTLSDELTSER